MSLLRYFLKLLPASSTHTADRAHSSSDPGVDPVKVGDLLSRLVVIASRDRDDDSDAESVAGGGSPFQTAQPVGHLGTSSLPDPEQVGAPLGQSRRRGFRLNRPGAKSASDQRREWDSNPRRLAPHGFSRAAHLSALPSLRTSVRVVAPSWGATWWWAVNRGGSPGSAGPSRHWRPATTVRPRGGWPDRRHRLPDTSRGT